MFDCLKMLKFSKIESIWILTRKILIFIISYKLLNELIDFILFEYKTQISKKSVQILVCAFN